MGDIKNLSDYEAIDKLKHIALSVKVCMLATRLNEIPLSVRPMETKSVDNEGSIWFFSPKDSEKNGHIVHDNRVQLFYAGQGSECLSIYGFASVMHDEEKIKEFWEPLDQTWYDEGKEDPNLTLIKVDPVETYYWDLKHNQMVSGIKKVAGVIKGHAIEDDDSVEGRLNL